MKQIDSLWEPVVAAPDSAAEAKAVQSLHDFLKKEKISFEAFFETADGKQVSLQDPTIAANIPADPVLIKFYTGDEASEITKSNWRPKDVNNAYYLYHE